MARLLEEALNGMAGIRELKLNVLTGSVLVFYQPDQIDSFTIIIVVDEIREKAAGLALPEAKHFEFMPEWRAWKIGLISSALVLLVLNHKMLGTSRLAKSGNFKTLALITGLVIAYPVFLWGLKYPRSTRRLGYDVLINAVTLTLLILGESVAGLALALLVNVMKFRMALDLNKSRRRLRQMGVLPPTARSHQEPDAEAVFRKPIERMTYLSLLAAGVVFLVTRNLNRSFAVLLAGSPGAAGMAVPAANGVAVGRALERGIYIRNNSDLLGAGRCEVLVLDMAATIAANEATITEVLPLKRNNTAEDIVRLASVAQGRSMHVCARAIQALASDLHLGPLPVLQAVEYRPGLGVIASVRGQKILIGSQRFMDEEKVKTRQAQAKARRFRQLGLSPVFLAVDGKLYGLLGLEEHLRAGAPEMVAGLRALGINKIVLVAQDSAESVELAARQLGITEYYGGLGPQEKADIVRQWRAKGYTVGMVGDGIEDSLALAAADAGIALGCRRADSAAKVAGIVIPDPDPRLVAETIFLAQKNLEVSRQNFNFAMGLNSIGLGLGVAGLITAVGAAFLGHVGIMAVILNSKS